MTVEEIDKNINDTISTGDVILYFYLPDEIKCKKFLIDLESISNEIHNKKFYKVSINSIEEFIEKFGIKFVPYVLFFKDGKQIGNISGIFEKDETIQKINQLY
ncbi:thioredoxin family protein [archaeon]|jgi:thioredoxin-like negative regulator of GroEL|nr:thioredoxin family protein [archaeon]MBT4351919.1 thioredoxin family protein [archaeon]MBT4647468.1 thioredoxin family protein [archaeon]MBT6822035.1 thioredoxin family protein [archaeon]MBT7391629.1 thioredoxin family protein [archaeon]